MGIPNRQRYSPGTVIASHYVTPTGSGSALLGASWANLNAAAATYTWTPPVDVYYFVSHYIRVDMNANGGWAETRTMVTPYPNNYNSHLPYNLVSGTNLIYAYSSSIWRVALESGVTYVFQIQGVASGANNATYYWDPANSATLTGWAIPRFNTED